MKRLFHILGLSLLALPCLAAQRYEDTDESYSLITYDNGGSSNSQYDYDLSQRDIQVDPITVITPKQGERYARLTPQAIFKNVGSETAGDFYCYCEINPMGSAIAPSYIDSFKVDFLDLQATVEVTFAPWLAWGSIPYQAKFYAGQPGATGRDVYGIVNWITFHGMTTSGLDELGNCPLLELAVTNPVKDRATINYSLPFPTHVRICLYDVRGALVTIICDGNLAGKGSINWDCGDAREGVYFVYMSTPDFTKTLELIVHR